METPARGQAQPGQEGRFATVAGTLSISQGKGRAKRAGVCRFAPFAATLDPATLAALGLAGGRIWGALA